MRKRSEVSTEAAKPAEATTFRTKCAVCKLPQHLNDGTTEITCPKGHRGAFGIEDDGTKVQWVGGKFVPVGSVKEEPKPAPKLPEPESTAHPEDELPEPHHVRMAREAVSKPLPTRGQALKAYEGDRPDVVSVTYGAQKISAVQYNTFELGPFFLSTTVRPGESREDAAARAYEELSAFAEKVYEREFPKYMARVREAIAAAKK